MFTSDHADPHLAKGRETIERITSSPSVRSSVLQLLQQQLYPRPPLPLPICSCAMQQLSPGSPGKLRASQKQTMHQSIKISAPNKPQTSQERKRGGEEAGERVVCVPGPSVDAGKQLNANSRQQRRQCRRARC